MRRPGQLLLALAEDLRQFFTNSKQEIDYKNIRANLIYLHELLSESPPPENPLVISQPCIRLNDLEEVGLSGRHLTMFEMMGHHAFNKNTDEIYFKEETVRLCDEYFTKRIGIDRNYVFHLYER